MKYTTLLATSALLIISIQGCATKTYGRQGILTSYEQDTMTCREIDLESAKVRGFIDHVNKESEFSGRDVFAFFGDLGIGNSMEKSSAIESANKRLEQLRAQRNARKCDASPA